MASYRIGDDDIAGEADEVSAEEIGAVVRAMRKNAAGLARVRSTGLRTPYGQPVLAREQQTDASHYQTLGLGAVTLAVAGPTLLTQQALERFIPARMLLEQTAIGNLVTGIFVGVRPQVANLAAMPVSAYANASVGVLVSFDAIAKAINFTVNLLTVAAAQTISGALFGTVVRE